MNKYFIMYSNCILVKGAVRSVICDLQLDRIIFIPNDLYLILKKHKKDTIEHILNKYGKENESIILSYFELLESNKCIMYVDDLSLLSSFPSLSLDWDFPSVVTNAIIDFDDKCPNYSYIDTILKQLDEFNTKYIQLRFYSLVDEEKICTILTSFKDLGIIYVELILQYNDNSINDEFINRLLEENRLCKIIFYNSPFIKYKRVETKICDVFYIQENILSEKCCGKIFPAIFTANIQLFSEAQKYNTCLNRKISVDVNGNIKNCPSMKTHFGNISDVLLKSVVAEKAFSQLWHINKDAIKICKDCEFRYVCTDCRAYLEDTEDLYSKPLKCGYDPYTCKWEKWSLNPLKQDSIKAYNLERIIQADNRG